MKTKKLFLLFSLITLVASCSKSVEKTSAKLNLKLAGIVNLSSGIGSGGAILFGKSSTGEQFGKLVTGAEENLDLPNGDWSFYTVMWEKTSGNNLADVAYCGKSFEKLAGAAVSINLNLNNANCADSDFSGGNHYQKYISGAGNKNTFARFFIEDCDDLTKTGSITCSLPNQGNALSYRMVFKSYKKLPGGALVFSNEMIRSQCVNVSTLHTSGMNINFPTSNYAMPFVASVEMYLGTTDCSGAQTDIKGMYTHTFPQGLSGVNPGSKMVFNGGYTCTPANSIMTDVCANYMGTMSGGICSVSAVISNFVAKADCSTVPTEPTATSFRNIKQMVAVPKSVLCYADTSTLGVSGTDAFPAGDGTSIRPFKICNEWQMNQIGEVNASAAMSTYHYKLLNDLDMNQTDFGSYPKPTCSGVAGSSVENHHNFNPLDGLWNGACDAPKTSHAFTGYFNGNNKTISHARISAESVEELGFIRRMESGMVRDLSFENLEVRGMGTVGGIAGIISATGLVEISNIKINRLDLEAKYNSAYPSTSAVNVGGIAGKALKNSSTININTITIMDAEVYGNSDVAGLVGFNEAIIQKSKFSGLVKAQSGGASSSVGGLVSSNNAGTISTSLSEGMILSSSKYVGGIVAQNAGGGTITSSYSTMLISASTNIANAYVGGIVGNNINGSYVDTYFDGVLYFPANGTTPSLHSISNGDPSNNPVGVCRYTDVGSAIANCSSISRGDLMAGNLFAGKTEWQTGMVGTLPRLKWEQETNSRPCLMTGNTESVTVQKDTMGRGTSPLSPIVICNPSQLSALSALSAGNIAVLGDDINLSDWTEADLITSFSGILDGRNRALYGLGITNAAVNASGIAIIKNNSGSILNLNVFGNHILSDVQMPYSGILTAKNSGTIKDIKFNSNFLSGYTYVGVIAGENSGVIGQVEIKNNFSDGHMYVGGAVGKNAQNGNSVGGKIIRVSSDSLLKERSALFPDYSNFGGIVGLNAVGCTVDQVLFDGSIALSYTPTMAMPVIGGIVGKNFGTVSNALTTNRSEIFVLNSEVVGGIAGSNSGTVRDSISLGRVLYTPNPADVVPTASPFSSTVGQPIGPSTNLYFLEKQLGAVVASNALTQGCNGTDVSFISDVFTVNPKTPDLYLKNGGYYNNSLKTLSSVISTGLNSMSYVDSCVSNESFTFIKSYGPAGMPAASFANPANFSALNMAYPGYLEENVIEYHKSLMYKRAPAMAIPIWVMEDGDDHPKLLQVKD